MSQDKDVFGDRMKAYESSSTSRKCGSNPLIARLDGKNFSTLCKSLNKPYDERLSNIMDQTLLALVKEFHVTLGYTQSDEISLCWILPEENSKYPFDGKFQKIESILAAYASVVFNRLVATLLPEKAEHISVFDCRSWEVPSKVEAANCFLWRQQDALKNSISMAAQKYFSPKKLMGKNGLDKKEMLRSVGINFDDYPSRFRHGVFAQRHVVERCLSEEELQKINPKYHPKGPVTRSQIDLLDMQITANYFSDEKIV